MVELMEQIKNTNRYHIFSLKNSENDTPAAIRPAMRNNLSHSHTTENMKIRK